jgi:transaldolase
MQAKQLGCSIITMPPKIINQIASFGKSFDKLTLETVKGFLNDSKKSKFRL